MKVSLQVIQNSTMWKVESVNYILNSQLLFSDHPVIPCG